MDPTTGGDNRGGFQQPASGGGGTVTLTSDQGLGLGVLPGDSAYTTTTVSSGIHPTTGQPTTTYQTYTVGAVPTADEEGTTAGYATYQTYTATTVGVPVEMSAGGGGGVTIEDMSMGGRDTGDIGGSDMGAGDIGGGGAPKASEIEMSEDIGAGMGGGMGTGGGDDDVGGMAGGPMGGGGMGSRDQGSHGTGPVNYNRGVTGI